LGDGRPPGVASHPGSGPALTQDSAHPESSTAAGGRRVALGLSYDGSRYQGWQSQPGGRTVQDCLEAALSAFAAQPVHTVCAGRTDAGVHAFNQVVHLDAPVQREPFSWVRGTNRYLGADIAVQWCRPVPGHFHARGAAWGRRYRYLLLESPVRPALESGRCGWVFRPLQAERMTEAAACLIGEHDFSAFRSSACQSPTPVKTLRSIRIERHGNYWRFDFDGSAFLHHMVRNIMGCLVAIGSGARPPGWMAEVLASRNREVAAPTFAPDGLYFVGPYYDPVHGIPDHTPAMGWHP
jgi:tRNA pseudouridine38-40 synthase